jgi:hypothetical protein
MFFFSQNQWVICVLSITLWTCIYSILLKSCIFLSFNKVSVFFITIDFFFLSDILGMLNIQSFYGNYIIQLGTLFLDKNLNIFFSWSCLRSSINDVTQFLIIRDTPPPFVMLFINKALVLLSQNPRDFLQT